MILNILRISLILIGFNLSAATHFILDGHLSEKLLDAQKEKLASPASPLLIQVNSSSGDLIETLDFVREIYTLKEKKGIKVAVFIDEKVLGPAAIIPFLADSLFTTPFVSWGAIPLETEDPLPTHILRNQVVSLINPDNPKAKILRLMAEAMTDPTIEISDPKMLSKSGETLVLNHYQLKEIGIIDRFLTEEQFRKVYELKEADAPLKEIKNNTPLKISPKNLAERFAEFVDVPEGKPISVGHIIIDDRKIGINEGTWLYVKSALDAYKKSKPSFIILELNTPGGQVYPSQKISDALKEMDTQYGIPTVAYINNWAISAGAMLAYSCRFIVIVKDAAMGAAEPVLQGAEGNTVTASEKVNSALRADFSNRARFFDRNPLLAEAMVDNDMILVFRHGKIVKLERQEDIRLKGSHPDRVITNKDKLLTLDSEKLINLGVADLLVQPVKLEPITEKEKEEGKWPASKVLLFQQPPFDILSGAIVDSYQMDWKVTFFAWLAHPMVASVLFLGMLMGFYMEFSSPGFGLPGGVATVCLTLIILSSFALQAVSALELILLCIGLLLLAVELFVIPGFGVVGIAGILFMLTGILGLMLPNLDAVDFDTTTGTWNAAGEVFIERLAWLSGAFVMAIVLMFVWAKYFMTQFTLFQHLVLQGSEENSSEGYQAGIASRDLPSVGAQGFAATTLRPSGKIEVEGTLYDAMSASSFIEKGEKIIVVRIESGKPIVDPQSEEENQ